MKPLLKQIALALLLSAAPLVLRAAAPEGLEFHFIGQNNCFVRVLEQKHYLLLPIQESVPDADMRVLADGEYSRTIRLRLAQNHVDYYVPLDLTAYKGKNVVLETRVHSNGYRQLDIKDEKAWQEMRLSDSFNAENVEKFRPAYHHTPLWGWMNDPNGMFYKDGKWHLFYQHNPFGSLWQNLSWGHSVSTDLVHWQHLPEALEPTALGMIFSGSSVVDHNNTAGFGHDAVVSLYTACNDPTQVQSLAYSTDDGLTFTNYPGNPIIVYPRETRDPNMFWDEKTGRWVLLLASALDHEMVIFTSADLKQWTKQSSFGRGYGSQDGVWECPDFMQLPVRGTKSKKWVLVCNINPGGPFGGSGTQYFVGDFDGKTFTASTRPSVTKWMDYGKDHYATVSFSGAPNGRHTVIAWMSNWQYAAEVPTKQFRSANSLPRDLELFRGDDGDYYLSVKPAEEVTALRDGVNTYRAAALGAAATTYALPAQNDGACEICLDVDMAKAKTLDITLSNDKGENVVMTYNLVDRTFSMNRYNSGDTSFSGAFAAETSAPLHSKSSQQKLRLFIDRCSIEAFDADGHFAMTNLVFPSQPYSKLTLATASGNARLNALNIYPLNANKK